MIRRIVQHAATVDERWLCLLKIKFKRFCVSVSCTVAALMQNFWLLFFSARAVSSLSFCAERFDNHGTNQISSTSRNQDFVYLHMNVFCVNIMESRTIKIYISCERSGEKNGSEA